MKELYVAVFSLVAATTLSAQYADSLVDRRSTPFAGTLVEDPRNRRVIVIDQGARMWDWDGVSFRMRHCEQIGINTHAQPAFDPVNQVLYMSGSTALRTWDGAHWTTTPTLFYLGGMLEYDEARQCLVSFQSGAVAELRAGVWSQIVPTTNPGSIVAWTYDRTRNRCVAIAGAPIGLWEWTGTNWNRLPGNPPSCTAGSLACDPIHNRLVLCANTVTVGVDTWQYNGNTWSQIVTPPSIRTTFANLAFDGIGILRMGYTTLPYDDIWRLEGHTWRRLREVPPRPFDAAIASSPTRGDIVQFGGSVGWNQVMSNQTFTFDGDWHLQFPAISPSPRSYSGLAWSATDQAYILFGGADAVGPRNDTWRWDGTNWARLVPANSPPPTQAPLLVSDANGGVLLLPSPAVAGPNTQWAWNGVTWIAQPSLTFASGGQLGAAYDPARNRVILGAGNVIHEWDGTTWSAAIPSLPWLAYYTNPVYRPDTQRILFSQGPFSEEWDGVQWTPWDLTTNAITRLVTDFARGRVIAPGASSISGVPSEISVLTWSPANVAWFGNGCAIGPTPGLTTLGLPIPGNTSFRIEGQALPAIMPGVLAFGHAPGSVPIGSGCTLLVAAMTGSVPVVTSSAGRFSVPLPIPNNRTLRGVTLTAQLAIFDPTHGQLGGFSLSNGLRLTIGD